MVKILYIEDEPFLAKIVTENLQTRGYQVKLLPEGRDMYRICRSFQPQICLLDVMLPNKDGFAIAEEIRSWSSAVPILFVTAKNQTEDVLKGFAAGGNDYIRKPFSLEELVARIENLLQLSASHIKQENDLQVPSTFGSYTLLAMQMKLKQRDKLASVKLSYREVQILQVLLRYQNKPVDRKVILKEVWGDDSFFNSRNLDVYIRKLRAHLASSDSVQIITLKGVGYLFSVSEE